jgi:hypothetical protein
VYLKGPVSAFLKERFRLSQYRSCMCISVGAAIYGTVNHCRKVSASIFCILLEKGVEGISQDLDLDRIGVLLHHTLNCFATITLVQLNIHFSLFSSCSTVTIIVFTIATRDASSQQFQSGSLVSVCKMRQSIQSGNVGNNK